MDAILRQTAEKNELENVKLELVNSGFKIWQVVFNMATSLYTVLYTERF